MRRITFLAIALAGFVIQGCELFGLDDATVEINVPEYTSDPVEIPLQAVVDIEIPQGESITKWIGPGPVDIDLISMEPRLEKYKDNIDGIEIRKIAYQITENTLDAEFPPLEFYFAEAGALGQTDDPAKSSQAVKYGQTGKITPGETHDQPVEIVPEDGAVEATSEIMASLAFSSIFGTHLTLDSNTQLPQGKLVIRFVFQLTVIAKAF